MWSLYPRFLSLNNEITSFKGGEKGHTANGFTVKFNFKGFGILLFVFWIFFYCIVLCILAEICCSIFSPFQILTHFHQTQTLISKKALRLHWVIKFSAALPVYTQEEQQRLAVGPLLSCLTHCSVQWDGLLPPAGPTPLLHHLIARGSLHNWSKHKSEAWHDGGRDAGRWRYFMLKWSDKEGSCEDKERKWKGKSKKLGDWESFFYRRMIRTWMFGCICFRWLII